MTYKQICIAIYESDWEALLADLSQEEIERRRVSTCLSDYKWEGDYSTDARYTYPERDKLIGLVIGNKLKTRR